MKKIILLGLIFCTKLAMSVECSQVSDDASKEHEQVQEQIVNADEKNEATSDSLWCRVKKFIRKTLGKDGASSTELSSSDDSQNLDEQESDVGDTRPHEEKLEQKKVDHLQQEETARELSLEEIMSCPDQIKNISIERIAKFNFSTVSPEFFLRLSKENIMALLERLEFLAKFNQKQWDNLITNIIKKLNFEVYDDLWQHIELNINFIVTKTNFFNRLNAAEIKKITPLVFQKMLPDVFKKLSPEKYHNCMLVS